MFIDVLKAKREALSMESQILEDKLERIDIKLELLDEMIADEETKMNNITRDE